MNKYYTQINIKLSTSQIQTGDKELRSLFSNSKPKVKIYIERVDKTKDKRERKRILPKNILSERIVNLK